jgi:aminopeptidase-like protein
MLAHLQEPDGSAMLAAEAQALIEELYPLCRSITGDGVRRTLDRVGELIPLDRSEVPSGTPAFDWEVPNEWNIRDAWVADGSGRRLIDFRAHSLHVVSYSVPVRLTLSRAELEPHLHSLPDRPDWIPYRTSYYREDWGFCLRHRDREALGPGPFEVVIDSQLGPGHLTYAESIVPGREAGEALIYTHVCHPSLANDNLTGIAVAALLARELRREAPRLAWRFVFAPGTIGSLTWLSRNETLLPQIRAGLVIGLLGDPGPLTFKRSRLGGTGTDRAVELVLAAQSEGARVVDFEPYGYDERQFCSPGIDLPVGRLTRSPNGAFAEYHTSADNPQLIDRQALAGSIRTLARAVSVLDMNRRLLNLSPKGEPRLGKRGLYRATGGMAPATFESALFWILSLSDGAHDLVAIAQRSGIPFEIIDQAATALAQAGLVQTLPSDNPTPRGRIQ